jgi:hypothetical protein
LNCSFFKIDKNCLFYFFSHKNVVNIFQHTTSRPESKSSPSRYHAKRVKPSDSRVAI